MASASTLPEHKVELAIEPVQIELNQMLNDIQALDSILFDELIRFDLASQTGPA